MKLRRLMPRIPKIGISVEIDSLDELVVSEHNPLVAVIACIVAFFLLLGIFYFLLGGITQFKVLVSLAISLLFAFSKEENVEFMTTRMLLYRGIPTGVRATGGKYYIPGFGYLWAISDKEVQSLEAFDVEKDGIKCQDNNQKPLFGAYYWKFRISDSTKFKVQNAEKIVATLKFVLERTLMKYSAKLPYRSAPGKKQILGEDLAEDMKNDEAFKEICSINGLEPIMSIADALASNLDQEGIISYSNELYDIEKAKFPANHILTAAERDKMDEKVDIKMKLVKKIITNSPLLGRFDVGDGH